MILFNQLDIAGSGSITIDEYEGALIKSMTYPGGVKRSYEYDGLARLQRILVQDNADNTKMDFAYQRDLVGNIEERVIDQETHKYEYDNAYRLTGAEQPNSFGDKTYAYDKNSNRSEIDESASNATSTYRYNNNQELIGIEKVTEGDAEPINTSMEYDNNGALILETRSDTVTRNYNQNGFARIESVNENGNELASYKYDAQSRRISKTISGVTIYFLYDDSGIGLVGEYNQLGELIRGYSYGSGNLFMTDPIAQKVPTPSSQLLEFEFSYYQNDHLGTPQRLINSAGATTWSADYDVFGETQESLSVSENPLRFPGQYFDTETGNHQNWNRYYNPTIGRYVTSDPIGLGGGLNTYGYAYQNPLYWTDPKGLSSNVLTLPKPITLGPPSPIMAVAGSGVFGYWAGSKLYPYIALPLGDAIDYICLSDSTKPDKPYEGKTPDDDKEGYSRGNDGDLINNDDGSLWSPEKGVTHMLVINGSVGLVRGIRIGMEIETENLFDQMVV